jgi:CPA1 family monovalent cation:H+ antiporter
VFGFAELARTVPRLHIMDAQPGWRNTFVVAFTGMRGAVSLAAALAIPEDVAGRNVIVFLCFTTILWTVCLEGLSLPWLLRRLDVHEDDTPRREEDAARLVASEAAIGRLEELAGEDWVRDDTVGRVRAAYTFRGNRFRQRLGKDLAQMENMEADVDGRSQDYQRLLREIISAQREALLDLRRHGKIGDEVLRRVQRDLDLEETRLEY